jgi:ABC-type sugar transport system ATPase subunit
LKREFLKPVFIGAKMSTPTVKLSNISKRFPGALALNKVNLNIYPSEVLALVGENGAGKSTMMKILSGVYPYGEFEGDFFIHGKKACFTGPLDAERAGIAIIHQELSTFPTLTVCENFMTGHWPLTNQGLINWNEAERLTNHWLEQVGAPCKAKDTIGQLSVGTQQLIEIAKALSRDSQVVIFDEPTSSLTPYEAEKLFSLIQKLKTQGKAIVYISHKMEEIFNLSDRIYVLRDGTIVHEAKTASTKTDELVEHMVGRAIKDIYPKPPERKLNLPLLEVRDFSMSLSGKKIGPLNFTLHQGEILGFGGLLGSGRTEFMRGLFGDDQVERAQGSVSLSGKPLSVRTPRSALVAGISFVSEDRKGESILPTRSLAENETLSWLNACFKNITLPLNELETRAQKRLFELNTKYSNLTQHITELSGGNQQKVIIGRAMETDAKIIILDEPTRGIDVGAKREVYEIIFKLAQMGKGILLVSSDLPELMALSDRVIMMRDGKASGELERKEFSQVNLMRLAFGA